MMAAGSTNASEEKSIQCNCQSLLLQGYIHNTQRRNHLSHSISIKIKFIIADYYDTECHSKYFTGHVRPKWMTATGSFSNFLLKLSKMLSKLLAAETKHTQWDTMLDIRLWKEVPDSVNTALDISRLVSNNIQMYLAVKSLNFLSIPLTI